MTGRFFTLLLVFSILSSAVSAQFEWVNPSPEPHRLRSIHFVDSLYAWAVGENSAVVKTTDGGETWAEQSIPFRAPLRNVYFADRNRGWIISGNDIVPTDGSLLYTTDGGDTWTAGISLSSGNGFNDMCFVSRQTGYLAGFHGVKKTTDGGGSWQNAGGTNWTTAVFFIDSLVGWFGNTVGGVYKTVDGGNSWSQVQDIRFHWHKKIKFATPSIGWMISQALYGDYSTIYKTTDGGENWFLQDSLPNRKFEDIRVMDSLNVWVVGHSGVILYTVDGGEMWFSSITNNSDNYFGISFQGTKKWVVGGGNYPIIFSSRETGFRWELRSQNITKRNLAGIAFADDLNGWFVGSEGEVFQTTDGGAHWNRINLFSIDFTSIAVPAPDVIYLAGAGGEFVRSFDGGTSWNISQIQIPYGSHQIQFFSETTGYSFNTDMGRLKKTTDGGDTWIELGDYFSGFFFVDSLHGWTYQNPLEYYDAYIYRTQDGGLTWPDTTAVHGLVQSIFFLDENNGWYSVHDTLYHTQDGGQNWNIKNPSLGFSVTDMIFTSENEGFLLGLGADGLTSIYHTNDGGSNFAALKKYTALNSLFINNSDYAWAVGDHGQVLKFDLTTVGIEGPAAPAIIEDMRLEQNFPNPFNPVTTIRYSIGESGWVLLKVYDLLGREVGALVNKQQAAGYYEVMFDASGLSSGVYFYRLRAGNSVRTKKFIVMK